MGYKESSDHLLRNFVCMYSWYCISYVDEQNKQKDNEVLLLIFNYFQNYARYFSIRQKLSIENYIANMSSAFLFDSFLSLRDQIRSLVGWLLLIYRESVSHFYPPQYSKYLKVIWDSKIERTKAKTPPFICQSNFINEQDRRYSDPKARNG